MTASNRVEIDAIDDAEIEALLAAPAPTREPDSLALVPEDALFDLLHAADKIDSGYWRMRCPAHRGEASSTLEVSLEAGRFRLQCICGCPTDKILQAAIDASARRYAGMEARQPRLKLPPRAPDRSNGAAA